MERKTRYSTLIIICIIVELLLIVAVPILESFHYPLIGDITCIETRQKDDLYWNINQIECSQVVYADNGSVLFTLSHNVPSFGGFLMRTGEDTQWKLLAGDQISLPLRKGENTVEVKATTLCGVETPAITWRIVRINGELNVIPDKKRIVRGGYEFRFEGCQSPKIVWLRGYTLPVVQNCKKQWDQYIALGRWVREQIPFKDPVIKSHWDAQRILKTVWGDASVGFICDAFAATFTSACSSVGLNARMLHLGSAEGSGHYATEIWSDEYQKWTYMDPLYGWYFEEDGEPLSALELHNVHTHNEWGKVEKTCIDENRSLPLDITDEDYSLLFHDIMLINASDFLSNPFTSVLDLLTLRIRYIRWIDESNPAHKRGILVTRLVLFYYLPKIAKVLIIPVVIPFMVLVLSLGLAREVYKKRERIKEV